jgi:hypothetical protein
MLIKDTQFCKDLFGDPLVMESCWSAKCPELAWCCTVRHVLDVTSNILDAHLPRMCRAFRKNQREALIETMQTVAAERKHELARFHCVMTSMNLNDFACR